MSEASAQCLVVAGGSRREACRPIDGHASRRRSLDVAGEPFAVHQLPLARRRGRRPTSCTPSATSAIRSARRCSTRPARSGCGVRFVDEGRRWSFGTGGATLRLAADDGSARGRVPRALRRLVPRRRPRRGRRRASHRTGRLEAALMTVYRTRRRGLRATCVLEDGLTSSGTTSTPPDRRGGADAAHRLRAARCSDRRRRSTMCIPAGAPSDLSVRARRPQPSEGRLAGYEAPPTASTRSARPRGWPTSTPRARHGPRA